MDSKYWCDKTILISVDGPDGYFCTAVEKPFARIGSHGSSEIVLLDESVASRGLYLHVTDEGIFYVDLSPPDVAANPLRGSLAAGQILSLGAYRISAKIVGRASDISALPDLEAKGSSQPPEPMVTISVRGQEIARRLLRRRLTIVGRVKPSTMRIKSPYVSASHCVLYWHDGVLWAIDLLSGNNTLLDGKQIDVAQIPTGHPLRLGNVLMNHLPRSEGPLTENIHDQPPEIPAESPTVFRAEICPEDASDDDTPDDAPANATNKPLDPVGVDNTMVPAAGEPVPETGQQSPHSLSAAGDSNLWLGVSAKAMVARLPPDASADQDDDEVETVDETDDQASIFSSNESKTSPIAPTVVEHRAPSAETPVVVKRAIEKPTAETSAEGIASEVEIEITEGDMVSAGETAEAAATESDTNDTPNVDWDVGADHESETSLTAAGSTEDGLIVVPVSDATTPQNYEQYLDLADGEEDDSESSTPTERDDADDDYYFVTDRLIELNRGDSRSRYLVGSMMVFGLAAIVVGVLFFVPQILEFLR